MGISHADSAFFRENFESSGVLRCLVLFVNPADDPPIERPILPRMALTVAKHLAYDLELHVCWSYSPTRAITPMPCASPHAHKSANENSIPSNGASRTMSSSFNVVSRDQ